MTANDIIQFWFTELAPKQWWIKDSDFDQMLKERFGELLTRAAACECDEWRQTAEGRLAEIIVLDQFSRNIYRDTPQAFSQDPLALDSRKRPSQQAHSHNLRMPITERSY